jgi:hypothetical protein
VVELFGSLGGGRSSCEPCGGGGWILVSHWRRGVTLVRFGPLLDPRWCGGGGRDVCVMNRRGV